MSTLGPDDQPPEGTPPGAHDWPADWQSAWTAPDDISALEADVEALRRERQAARRARRWRRLLLVPNRRAYGISGPMVVAALLLIGAIGALLALFGPRGGPTIALPVAATDARPGLVGGPLPHVQLEVEPDQSVDAQTGLYRPGVLVVVPAGCACATAVDAALSQTAHYPNQVYGYLVTTSEAEARSYLTAEATPAQIAPLVDATGGVLRTFGTAGAGPTVVAVGDSGLVTGIQKDVTATTDLTPLLRVVIAAPATPVASGTAPGAGPSSAGPSSTGPSSTGPSSTRPSGTGPSTAS